MYHRLIFSSRSKILSRAKLEYFASRASINLKEASYFYLQYRTEPFPSRWTLNVKSETSRKEIEFDETYSICWGKIDLKSVTETREMATVVLWDNPYIISRRCCLCALEAGVITLLGELISRQATVINSCWKGTRAVKQISIGNAIDAASSTRR